MNTHYGVIVFSGDFDNDHPDAELRGCAPRLTLIVCGDEEFCWKWLARWTMQHPLRRYESVEVLARVPSVVGVPVSDVPSSRTTSRSTPNAKLGFD
jgi:hypothetical protein